MSSIIGDPHRLDCPPWDESSSLEADEGSSVSCGALWEDQQPWPAWSSSPPPDLSNGRASRLQALSVHKDCLHEPGDHTKDESITVLSPHDDNPREAIEKDPHVPEGAMRCNDHHRSCVPRRNSAFHFRPTTRDHRHHHPGNGNIESLEDCPVTAIQRLVFLHSQQAYPGSDPGEDEEGGEDDDAKGGEGDQAHHPLPVKGQGPARKGGNTRFPHLKQSSF